MTLWILTLLRGYSPDRDLRCIFDDALVGDVFGAAIALDGGDAEDIAEALMLPMSRRSRLV